MRLLLVISLSLCSLFTSAQKAEQQIGINLLGGFGLLDDVAETAMSRSLDLRYQYYFDSQTFMEFSGGYEALRRLNNPDISKYRCAGGFLRASINLISRSKWFIGGIGMHLAMQKQNYTVKLGGERFPAFTRDYQNDNTPVSLFASMGMQAFVWPKLGIACSFELYRSMVTRNENTERIYHVAGTGAGLNPSHRGALLSAKLNVFLFYRLFPE